jgi:enoyl-CoA hydratase
MAEIRIEKGNVIATVILSNPGKLNAIHIAIANCLHPTLAAIEGVCVDGALEIAGADMRIAAASSRFGIPINRLGFPLAPGEMQHFLQLVGKATALDGAAEAKDKGLINRVAETLPAEARKAAERIVQGAPLAARMNRQLARRLAAQP